MAYKSIGPALSATLAVDPSASPQAIAENLLKTIQSELPSTKPEDAVYELWHVIFDAARAGPAPEFKDGHPSGEPFDHLAKLVLVVHSLQSTASNNTELGNRLPQPLTGQFGPTARYHFEETPLIHKSITQSSIDKWTNLSCFLALLWKSSDADSFDFELFALWSFREALETKQPLAAISAVVPGVAAWIAITGEKIWKNDKKWPAGPLTGDPARPGDYWREIGLPDGEVNGFVPGRWHFWKMRFYEIADQEDVDDSIRQIAATTAQNMQRIGPWDTSDPDQ